jgi:hypothetical protein
MNKKNNYFFFLFISAAALSSAGLNAQDHPELRADALADFEKYALVKTYSKTKNTLWGLGPKQEIPVYVRRDLIHIKNDVQEMDFHVEASFYSENRDKLDAINFYRVSGKELEFLPKKKLRLNDIKKPRDGIDLINSTIFANVAYSIYLTLPRAAKVFYKMGFKKQHFVVGVDSDIQGVVLEDEQNIVIAFRGTEPTTIRDWKTNAQFWDIPIAGHSPRVHKGFYSSLMEIWPFVEEHLVSTLENKIRKIALMLSPEDKTEYQLQGEVKAPNNKLIHFTGHSLGAALASLALGESILSNNEQRSKPYLFLDPTLKQWVSDNEENLHQLIFDTIQKESIEGLEKRSFSIFEENNFIASRNFKGMAKISRDKEYTDARIRNLITFGSPRAGDWIFKHALESYAIDAQTHIVRFENLRIKNSGRQSTLIGDLVTRIPLAETLLAQYSHLGVRVYFDSEEDSVIGNFDKLHCEYTNREAENRLNHVWNLMREIQSTELVYHKMPVYLNRITSLFGTNSLQDKTPAILPEGHSCKDVSFKAEL